MKICSICKEEKSSNSFSFVNKLTGKLHSYCNACRQKYYKKYYSKNIVRLRETAKIHKAQAKERVRALKEEYLSTHPCIDCGETDSVVLEFDHVRGEKRFNIADSVKLSYGVKRVQQEIDKCEVRCANCHRRKTQMEA